MMDGGSVITYIIAALSAPSCLLQRTVSRPYISSPLPRRPWFYHCRVNNHAIEDYPELIAKWEDRNRERASNFINSKSRITRVVVGPTINVVARGGTHTGTDAPDANLLRI